jgi:hypothetical protein
MHPARGRQNSGRHPGRADGQRRAEMQQSPPHVHRIAAERIRPGDHQPLGMLKVDPAHRHQGGRDERDPRAG